jgi:hypothetical protein
MTEKEVRILNLIAERIDNLNIYRESIGDEPHTYSEIKFLEKIAQLINRA